MSRKNKKTNKLNNKGFITIEALLVIMVIMIFSFFILEKVAKKLEFFGDKELSNMRSVIGFADYGEDINNYPKNEKPKEEDNPLTEDELILQDEDY